MASFEAHCEQCVKEMGEAFAVVRREWGDKAAIAAEIHIRQDLEGEGWPSDAPIPADGRAYKKSGLW